MISPTLFLGFLIFCAASSLYIGIRVVGAGFRTRRMLTAGRRVYDRVENPVGFYGVALFWLLFASVLVIYAFAEGYDWIVRVI